MGLTMASTSLAHTAPSAGDSYRGNYLRTRLVWAVFGLFLALGYETRMPV